MSKVVGTKLMKLLNRINERAALKGEPYTPQEIDKHEDAERIWATIAQCKQEAQESVREAWDNGHWAGSHEANN